MAILNLKDLGTKAALLKHGLVPKSRIGRGCFAVVYAKGEDRVLKLTTDPVQSEIHRIWGHGPHFPELHVNHGIVGEQDQGKLNLWLLELERLQSMRYADQPTRELAKLIRRQGERASRDAVGSVQPDPLSPFSDKVLLKRQRVTLARLTEDRELPVSIREAFGCLYLAATNELPLQLDMHSNNFMVRGKDQLILNDIACDHTLLCREFGSNDFY